MFEPYDTIPLKLWEMLLNENMDYHVGYPDGPSENVFLNTAYLYYPYLKDKKKILDAGCGFGGLSRNLKTLLPDLEITAVTNSEMHYDYGVNHPSEGINYVLSDLNEWSNDEKFDAVIFNQSFSHMNNDVVSRINTDLVLMVDFLGGFDGQEDLNMEGVNVYARSMDSMENIFSSAGFEIKEFNSRSDWWYFGMYKPWYENMTNILSKYRKNQLGHFSGVDDALQDFHETLINHFGSIENIDENNLPEKTPENTSIMYGLLSFIVAESVDN